MNTSDTTRRSLSHCLYQGARSYCRSKVLVHAVVLGLSALLCNAVAAVVMVRSVGNIKLKCLLILAAIFVRCQAIKSLDGCVCSFDLGILASSRAPMKFDFPMNDHAGSDEAAHTIFGWGILGHEAEFGASEGLGQYSMKARL